MARASPEAARPKGPGEDLAKRTLVIAVGCATRRKEAVQRADPAKGWLTGSAHRPDLQAGKKKATRSHCDPGGQVLQSAGGRGHRISQRGWRGLHLG